MTDGTDSSIIAHSGTSAASNSICKFNGAQSGEYWLSLSASTLDEENDSAYLSVRMPNGSLDERQAGIGLVAVVP